MTNPAPRPALRKAPDADVHPASPSRSATAHPTDRPRLVTASTATSSSPAIDLRNRQTSSPERKSSTSGKQTSRDQNDEVTGSPDTSSEAHDRTVDTGQSSHETGQAETGKKSKKKGSHKKKGSFKEKLKKKDKKKGKEKSQGKKKGKGKQSSAKVDRVDLRATVPASVRRTLRSSAKARGTSVEDTVDSVLTGWQPNQSN